jgi:hypothetical protein
MKEERKWQNDSEKVRQLSYRIKIFPCHPHKLSVPNYVLNFLQFQSTPNGLK